MFYMRNCQESDPIRTIYIIFNGKKINTTKHDGQTDREV